MNAIQKEIDALHSRIKTLNLSIVFYKRSKNTKKSFIDNLKTQRTELKSRLGVLKEKQKAKNFLKKNKTNVITSKIRKNQF